MTSIPGATREAENQQGLGVSIKDLAYLASEKSGRDQTTKERASGRKAQKVRETQKGTIVDPRIRKRRVDSVAQHSKPSIEKEKETRARGLQSVGT